MATTVPIQSDADDRPIPNELAEAFRRVGDLDEPPETLQEGFGVVEEALQAAEVEVDNEDMFQSEPTRHAVHVGDTVHHVPCVLDAMIVALTLDERPIEIHSEPPGGGEPVRFTVTAESVTVEPSTAAVSFGIGNEEAAEADPEAIKQMLEEESGIPTTCTVTNAFPDSAAYERWAADVAEAAIMELEIGQLVALACRFT